MTKARSPRRRCAAAVLPASLTAAALVAAPFAGSTTGPLTARALPPGPPPVTRAAAPRLGAAPLLAGACAGIAAAAARAPAPSR